MTVALHVNVDHVATLRQARGTPYPDPVEAAVLCEHAGADGITAHLREDRRHVQDRDVELLSRVVKSLLNLEMAVTDEMIAIATEIAPTKVTLVPEKRQERTTEGGLDVAGQRDAVARAVERLAGAGMSVSLFIDPDPAQVRASYAIGAQEIELHTGDYANAAGADAERELERLADAASLTAREAPGLRIAAGHGLTVRNTPALVARAPEIGELNIGHALVSDAVYCGLPESVRRFREAIERGERARERRHAP